MKFTSCVALYATANVLPGAVAWPGMKQVMEDLEQKLAKRQDLGVPDTAVITAPEAVDAADSTELIGDLATVGAVTTVGQAVSDIILGNTDPYSDVTWATAVPKLGSAACKADQCCVWDYIAADLKKKFKGTSGRCNGFARAAIRMGFHDAGTWSKNVDHGGADGSLILANEITRTENNGLQDIIKYTQTLYNTYKSYGISMADLIQMSATVATVVCPLGPRIRSFVGRPDDSRPSPNGLLPSVNSDADTLLQLFADKTIGAHGLTALVGAHTTSQQLFVNSSRAYDPQDSTPGVWDVNFYNQTIQPTSVIPKRVFKFQSDVALSQHSATSTEWNKFITDQGDWNEDYSREYVRLSLLGVNNINNLTECTKVLPAAIKTFTIPVLEKKILVAWLTGKFPKLGQLILDANALTAAILAALGYSI